jgi:hypothetical protein
LSSSASAGRVRIARPRRRRNPGCTLTDLDRRLLDSLCSLRVVRQDYVTVRLAAAAGPVALEPGRLLEEACLTRLDGESAAMLIDIVNEARVPFGSYR